jgi:hypothetical protein
MNNRAPIKRDHERANVEALLRWLNAKRKIPFSIIAAPDPPHAIIQSGWTIRWVEVGSIFMNARWAQDRFSHATPGERPRPFGKNPVVDPDEQFVSMFVGVLSGKLSKETHLPLTEKYGPGYLVLPLMHPLFGKTTFALMKRRWKEIQPVQNRGCFRGVYLTGHSLNYRCIPWRV